MAIDGDPNTAWTVLDPTRPVPRDHDRRSASTTSRCCSPAGSRDVRHLGTVTVTVNGGAPQRGRARRALAHHRAARRLPGDRRADDDPHRARPDRRRRRQRPPDRTPVGFAEIDVGLGQSPEVDRRAQRPDDGDARRRDRAAGHVRPDPGAGSPDEPLAVRSRVAHRPTARRPVRPRTSTSRPRVRIDRRAPDAVLAELLGIDGPTATARLTGVPAAGGWAAADGDDDTAWITPFDDVVGAALHAELVDPDVPLTLRQRLRQLLAGHRRAVDAGRARRSTCSSAHPTTTVCRSIAVPDGFAAGPLTIEIAAIDERTTRDRRFGDTVVLPAAISEIGNIVASSVPSDVRHRVPRRPRRRRRRGGARPGRRRGGRGVRRCGPRRDDVRRRGARWRAGTVAVTGQQDRRSGPAGRPHRPRRRRRPVDGRPVVDGPTATVVDSDRLEPHDHGRATARTGAG